MATPTTPQTYTSEVTRNSITCVNASGAGCRLKDKQSFKERLLYRGSRVSSSPSSFVTDFLLQYRTYLWERQDLCQISCATQGTSAKASCSDRGIMADGVRIVR